MSPERFNLNDDVRDAFPFTVNGLDYDLKYPTLKELEPYTDLSQQRENLSKKTDDASVKKLNEIDKKLTDMLYSFVKPVGHKTPIKDTLENSNIRIIRAFNKMVSDKLLGE